MAIKQSTETKLPQVKSGSQWNWKNVTEKANEYKEFGHICSVQLPPIVVDKLVEWKEVLKNLCVDFQKTCENKKLKVEDINFIPLLAHIILSFENTNNPTTTTGWSQLKEMSVSNFAPRKYEIKLSQTVVDELLPLEASLKRIYEHYHVNSRSSEVHKKLFNGIPVVLHVLHELKNDKLTAEPQCMEPVGVAAPSHQFVNSGIEEQSV